MATVLQELLAVGLIDKVDGDDGRLKKIERAVGALAETLRKEPSRLISAILAALNEDATIADPSIKLAEVALITEWKTVLSVYPDNPIHLYRSILFAACAAAAQGENAVILWLTAADTLPFSRLGAESDYVRKLVASFADAAEEKATSVVGPVSRRKKIFEATGSLDTQVDAYVVDRAELGPKLNAAVQNIQQAYNSPHVFVATFANQMKDVLGDLVDGLATQIASDQEESEKSLQQVISSFAQETQEAIATVTNLSARERLKIDTLWWYESLYSTSLRKSYREMSPYAATVLMPLDLLAFIPLESPSAVSYILSEAVARLPKGNYERMIPLLEVITQISAVKTELPLSRLTDLTTPINLSGRLSLRDVIKLSLGDTPDFVSLMERARIPQDAQMSLPQLARALFRQEQAVRIAIRKK